MRIECGDYVLQTDSMENMWIEEKFIGETKDKKPKESFRRVSGYLTRFSDLAEDFIHKELCKSGADDMKQVVIDLSKAEQTIRDLADCYKKEIAKVREEL